MESKQYHAVCLHCKEVVEVPESSVKNPCCVGFTCKCKRWLTVVIDPMKCLSCRSYSCSNMIVVIENKWED